MATVTILIGLPGAGKSAYADEWVNEDPSSVYIASSDAMRKKLYGSEEIQGDPNEVFRNLLYDILNLIHEDEDDDVYDDIILDATNLNRKHRISFIDRIRNKNPYTIINAILFIEPLNVLISRNEHRDRTVPTNVILKMLKSFNPPHKDEGFDDIFIHWSNDHASLPRIQTLRYFNQDNKHHTLSLGTHMLKAADYCKHHYSEKDDSITNYRRDRVVEAAKFHDIGKIVVKTFTDSKGNQTEDAHYYGHEHVGSYLYLNHINNELLLKGSCPFDNVSEYLQVANLIDFHMKPYTSWNQSEKALNRDIQRYGRQFINDVYKLHKADKEAK